MSKLILIAAFLNLFSQTANPAPHPRIVGGSTADPAQWPWMAGIGTDNVFYCGGSLIAKDWILTAAQCLQGVTTDTLKVIINHPNLQATQGETIPVKSVVIHPQFDSNSLANDIALVKLSRPSTTAPIDTLPNFSNQDQEGKIATVLGWGATTASLLTSIHLSIDLQQVNLPLVSNNTCSTALVGILDSMLCAGYAQGGADACTGDGGGPLVVFDDESQTWRLAGITSFGEYDCAAPGAYGVYTRVDRFNDFISNTICTPEAIPPTPILKLTTNGAKATATWTTSVKATGYRLFYAPYPSLNPIASIEQHQSANLSVNLPSGSAYYVAVNAYNGKCLSNYSNIEHFSIP